MNSLWPVRGVISDYSGMYSLSSENSSNDFITILDSPLVGWVE